MNIRMTWQQQGTDDWSLGEPIRGIIREPIARAWKCNDFCWLWRIETPGDEPRTGNAHSLVEAVVKVELDARVREILGLPEVSLR